MPVFITPNFVTLHPVKVRYGRLAMEPEFPTLEATRTETETSITYRRITQVDAPDRSFVFRRDPVCNGGSHHRLVGGELVKVSYAEALDELDPEGVPRRRYEARLGNLPRKPRRFTLTPDRADDEWVPGDTYPDERWEGAYVVCTQRAGRQVWYRAATYEEVVALGIRP